MAPSGKRELGSAGFGFSLSEETSVHHQASIKREVIMGIKMTIKAQKRAARSGAVQAAKKKLGMSTNDPYLIAAAIIQKEGIKVERINLYVMRDVIGQFVGIDMKDPPIDMSLVSKKQRKSLPPGERARLEAGGIRRRKTARQKRKIRKEETFYESRAWRELRYKALVEHGRKCQCCGAEPPKIVLHVDHIKPRSKFPSLELELDNLQILCKDCNLGKSNKDDTDFRLVDQLTGSC